MGVKRPFDEEALQELSFKQAKPLDGNNKPASIAWDISRHEAPEKSAISGDAGGLLCKPEFVGEFEVNKADKELETSAALSWVTSSSSSEEEAGNGGEHFLPLYPDFYEFNLPRRPPVQVGDAFKDLLDSSPRKEVPVGPDHQAAVPEWNPNAIRKVSLGSNHTTDDDNEQKWMGTTIIEMPDTEVASIDDDAKVGYGRTDCVCFDKGSIRCARQHVEEARKKLREEIGEEKFADLGFFEMGEEVALSWTEEEERALHEVVYSNPVSLGKKFWKHLSAVFPSRTKMELISYYFNVFILRRRAVQNRCDFLDIDSDDDEWQGDERHTEVGGEDEDSVVESFGNEDLQVDHELGVSDKMDDDIEDEGDEDDDDSDDSDDGDDGDGDVDVGTNVVEALEEGIHNKQMSKQSTEKSREDSWIDYRVNNMGKFVNGNSKALDSQAGLYSERHPFTMAFSDAIGEETILRGNALRSDHVRCLDGKSNVSSDCLGSGFIFDACDAKPWDNTFPTSHMKSIDLLPTCNMIEEIFGPCTWKTNLSDFQQD